MFRPAQNIGFAVPINTLKQVLPQLRDKGKVTRGYLGINIRNIDEDHASAFKLKNSEGRSSSRCSREIRPTGRG